MFELPVLGRPVFKLPELGKPVLGRFVVGRFAVGRFELIRAEPPIDRLFIDGDRLMDWPAPRLTLPRFAVLRLAPPRFAAPRPAPPRCAQDSSQAHNTVSVKHTRQKLNLVIWFIIFTRGCFFGCRTVDLDLLFTNNNDLINIGQQVAIHHSIDLLPTIFAIGNGTKNTGKRPLHATA